MVLGVIPARGGSKGIKGKNIRIVGGNPLIVHTIECAKQCSFIDHVLVSTDSLEIAEIARNHGMDVPFMRPGSLAEDATPMLPVLQHALTEGERIYNKIVNCLVLLDPTGPLRTVEDVERCWKLFREGAFDAVVSGNEAHRNPYFNMVKVEGGNARLVNEHDKEIGRRQDAPKVYDLNTVVWIYSRKALMEEKARLPRRTSLYLVPPERALDLDSEFDFQILEFLLARKRREA